MFGRARSHQKARDEAQRSEIQELRGQVARLEQALENVIAASDQVVSDMQRPEIEPDRSDTRSSAGFADAWTRVETQTPSADQFFTVGQVDQRARQWLLASS